MTDIQQEIIRLNNAGVQQVRIFVSTSKVSLCGLWGAKEMYFLKLQKLQHCAGRGGIFSPRVEK